MADAQGDFISQLRALNPDAGLEKYDDQTLASLVADQHPDYAPRLTKYLHPTADIATKALAQEGAQGIQGATPGELVPQLEAKKTFEPDNPYVEGATSAVQNFGSPTNVGIMAGATAASLAFPPAAVPIGVGFAAKMAYDYFKGIPELYRDLKAGMAGDQVAMNRFKTNASAAGMGTLLIALGVGFGAKEGTRAAPPEMVPDPAAAAAAKTSGKVAEAVSDIPGASEAAEAQKAAQEAAAEKAVIPQEPEPEGAPPIVKGSKKAVQTSSGMVEPNPPAMDEVRENLKEALRQSGVDPEDLQAQADMYQRLYGLSKPITVKSVGDVPVSESFETPNDYQINLADGDVSKVAHEVQHARQNEGQIPEVPEGPGANDQISQQVASDLTGNQMVPREINVAHLQTSDAVKAEIQQRVQELPPRAVIPRQQTLVAASNLGFSLEDAQRLADETGDLPQRLIAANQIVVGATEKYHLARDAWLADPSNLGAKQAAEMAQNTILQAMEPFTLAGTNVARSLNILGAERGGKWPAIPSDIADAITAMQKRGEVPQAIRDKILATDMGDPAQRQNLRKALGVPPLPGEGLLARISNRISQYFTNSILSGIPTQMRKLTTDVGTLLVAPLETLAAGEPKAAAARLLGNFSGVDDAWLTYVKSITQGSEHYQPTDAFGGMTGKIINTPTRNLGAITDFARQLHLGGALAENAIMDGATFAEAREAAVNPTQAQLDAAFKDASERVYAAKPGAFGSAASALRSTTPFGKIIEPVLQFPIKMAKVGVETSPAGLAKVAYDALNGKEITNAALGRGVLGSAMWAWVAHMVNAGKMTGEGPLDPEEFRRKEETGWRPNSIIVNGGYYPFGWFGGIGFSLSMAATLAESMREAPNAVDKAAAATMMTGHFGRFILNLPYMQGISRLVEALHDPRLSDKFFGGILGGFVPSLLAAGARATDQYDRELSTWVDMVRSRVPFFREEIPPKRDIEGDPLPAAGSPESRFAGAFSVSDAKPLGLPQRVAQDAKIGRQPGSIPYYGARLTLDPVDRDMLDQLSGQQVKQVFARINAAPSNFPVSTEAQRDQVKDIVSGARSNASLQMLKILKDRGTLDAYVAAATGKQQAKLQPNPYGDVLSAPGLERANDTLDRYQIPRQGLPSQVSPDLAPEYSRELNKALGMYLYSAYADPARFHQENPSFESAKAKVQQLYDIATKHAADEVLRRSGVKSAAEAP